jgi:hypothetical protein
MPSRRVWWLALVACLAGDLPLAQRPVAGSPNGRSLNGPGINGLSVNGASTGSVRLHGQVVERVSLVGTEFVAETRQGERRGRDFLGAEFTARLHDGSSLVLRVDEMERSDRPGEGDVLLYTASYARADARGFLCGVDEKGKPVRAVPLRGYWDERWGVEGGGEKIDEGSDFTFACEGFVLAKCVHAGYKPWAKSTCKPGQEGCREVSLEPYHRACVRMFRADYCGDGASYTLDGTPINLYDGIGIQTDDADWPFEAEWTPAGARCAKRKRIPDLPDPPCWARLAAPDCGALQHFQSGTLLMNEDGPRRPPVKPTKRAPRSEPEAPPSPP